MWDQKQAFSDGVLLAALVNPDITVNPLKALVDQQKIDKYFAKDNTFRKSFRDFASIYEVLKCELVSRKRLNRKTSTQEIEMYIKESAIEIEKLIAEDLPSYTFTSNRQEVEKLQANLAGTRYGFYLTPNETSNTETSATSLLSDKTLIPQ